MSTFTVARFKNSCYEAFSFTELKWKNKYSWIHYIYGKEFISFQGIYDPDNNPKLASYWLNQDYEYLFLNDIWFGHKQVITTNKGSFNVYTGKQGFPKIYNKIGNGWCCAGNLLEHDNYDQYFNDDIMNLSCEEIINKIKMLPVKLDRRTKSFEDKGSYFEYTLYNIDLDRILKRQTLYQSKLDLLQ